MGSKEAWNKQVKTKVSVIVLSKNNGETLENCLRSIINSGGDKEIIVVDAHSKDKTVQILKKYKKKVRVLYDEGKGIGVARNVGVRASSGEIICFVDADAYISRDHLIKITKYFDEHPDVGVAHVQGALRTSKEPTYIEKLAYIFQIRGRMGIPPYAGGYFLSFRRKVFCDVGGFWDFPPYGADDLDFTLRAMDKGWKKGWIKTEGWHQSRRTISGLWREMWGWGKGKSCFDRKYSSHPYVMSLNRRRKLYKILGKWYWLGIELIRLMAPIIALKYLPKWKSLGVYFYYIIKEWAHVLGYIWGSLTWARNL